MERGDGRDSGGAKGGVAMDACRREPWLTARLMDSRPNQASTKVRSTPYDAAGNA